ncbi:MAG: hypothetical protein HZA22_01895 [Nitrospirae bacterium]|nr:hypothetical protein [Nitrospirota bacterium]
MSFDFTALYEFHGHRCPMSTMGARLGLAAMAALGVTKADQFKVEGLFHTKNCALDGIQFTTGCTLGNGNLAYAEEGRAAFTLNRRDGRGGVVVTVSGAALERLSGFKEFKARLMEERDISGLARAMEIDAEINRGFDALVDWVQSADEGGLVTVTAA